jgi:N-acyl-L-homoserine lactone synthetase
VGDVSRDAELDLDLNALDRLAATLTARSGVRFDVAVDEDRDDAYRLRRDAVRERHWSDLGRDETELDEFDLAAVHLVGRRDTVAVCCGRLVLPPGPLPTEVACGLVIEPVGEVVDVGRMVVTPAARQPAGTVFLALLAALYLETRNRGYTTGCGMMASGVRSLLRHVGVQLDVLGPDRAYRGVQRAPVRFDVNVHGRSVLERRS